MKYKKRNPNKIALIIEIVLFIIGLLIYVILESIGIKINYIPLLIIFGIWLFSFLLTLSLIRYESLRNIRESFKDSNLPLYTDQTTLLGHDLKDEEKKKND